LLARVIESEILESLALGLAALVAPIELVFAAALLRVGAGGVWHAALLLAWIAALGVLIWRDYRCRAAWTETRLRMTDDLVERMNGHRTRLTQEHPDRWHAGEDQALAEYLVRSENLDRSLVRVSTLFPRLWLLVGLTALASAFLRSAAPASLALSIAAVLLAQRSLRTLTSGLGSLAGAFLAWRQIAPFFRAAECSAELGTSSAPLHASMKSRSTLLEVHDVTLRYRDRGEAVLRGCNLTVRRGDRIMLEGRSGNGKSTLASLVAGLRTPETDCCSQQDWIAARSVRRGGESTSLTLLSPTRTTYSQVRSRSIC
jgi:ATP-binding cassette subfamily B protein